MEWSRYLVIKKKKEEEESTSPAFSRSLRFILERPLFKQKKKKVQNRMHAKYVSRQRIGSTVRCAETGEKTSFFTFGQTLLFFSSHNVRIPFLEGGSERPEDGPTTGKFNYWQIHTVGPTSLLVCIIITIVYCIVAVQVQDGVCSMMIEIIIISGTRRDPTCELFMG